MNKFIAIGICVLFIIIIVFCSCYYQQSKATLCMWHLIKVSDKINELAKQPEFANLADVSASVKRFVSKVAFIPVETARAVGDIIKSGDYDNIANGFIELGIKKGNTKYTKMGKLIIEFSNIAKNIYKDG